MSAHVARHAPAMPTLHIDGRAESTTTPSSTPTGFVGMYDFRGTLGKGHFAVVKLAEHVLSKLRVAVKVIDKNKLQPDELEHLHHEVRVMKLIRHPHIIRLYQVHNTNNKLYLILELGSGGDLYEFLNKNGALPEDRARKLFRQIAQAVGYCHQHRVAHRDLKPENVVFCSPKNGEEIVKVTDFGLSNNFAPGEKMKTACGSLVYTCPEILLGDPYDGPQADIWSLGVILYMMICGKLPFQEHSDTATLIKIMDVKYKQPEHVSEDCRALLARLLVREPSERAKMAEILEHPWLATGAAAAKQRAALAEPCPTAARQQLTPEEHEGILRTMDEAGMARELVLKALEANDFDYLTSTYCLLAEREIRRRTRSLGRSTSGQDDNADGTAAASAARAAGDLTVAPATAVSPSAGTGAGTDASVLAMAGDASPRMRRNHTIHGNKPSLGRLGASGGAVSPGSSPARRNLRPPALPDVFGAPEDRSGSFGKRPSTASSPHRASVTSASSSNLAGHGHALGDAVGGDDSDSDELNSPRRCSIMATGQHTGSLRKAPAVRRASMHESLGLSPRFSQSMAFNLGSSPSSTDASPGVRAPRGTLGMPVLQRARSSRSKGTRHHRYSTTLGSALPLHLGAGTDDDEDEEEDDHDAVLGDVPASAATGGSAGHATALHPHPHHGHAYLASALHHDMTVNSSSTVPHGLRLHATESPTGVGADAGSDHGSEDGPEQSAGEPASPDDAPQMDVNADEPDHEYPKVSIDTDAGLDMDDDAGAHADVAEAGHDSDVLMLPSVPDVQRSMSIPNDMAAKGTEVHCIMEEDEEEEA